MRPINRGTAPRSYQQYEDAIEDLTAQLGKYCSYCERYIAIGLAVEHVLPKSLYPELKTEWTNLLLGCTNCNSVKSTQDIGIDDSLWPDRDNTLLAIGYTKGGFVNLTSGLNTAQQQKAQTLLDLVGLQRHPKASGMKPARRDKRWQNREEIWMIAERCRDDLEKLGQAKEARKLVLEVAKSRGFFSVWITVFENHPNIKRELIESFSGTATVCFDPNGKPLNRPGGNI